MELSSIIQGEENKVELVSDVKVVEIGEKNYQEVVKVTPNLSTNCDQNSIGHRLCYQKHQWVLV